MGFDKGLIYSKCHWATKYNLRRSSNPPQAVVCAQSIARTQCWSAETSPWPKKCCTCMREKLYLTEHMKCK